MELENRKLELLLSNCSVGLRSLNAESVRATSEEDEDSGVDR